MSTVRLSPAEQVIQDAHERRHPGAVCQQCPSVKAHQRRLEQRVTQLRSPMRLTDRGLWCAVLVLAILAVTIGWNLTSLVGWWTR
jgi:hypothetical protein